MTAPDEKARRIALGVLLGVLPDGVPPSWQAVISAKTAGAGRNKTITAQLLMFDGQSATVRLSRWSMGWSHRWLDLPGGDISYEGGRWVRVPTQEELAI